MCACFARRRAQSTAPELRRNLPSQTWPSSTTIFARGYGPLLGDTTDRAPAETPGIPPRPNASRVKLKVDFVFAPRNRAVLSVISPLLCEPARFASSREAPSEFEQGHEFAHRRREIGSPDTNLGEHRSRWHGAKGPDLAMAVRALYGPAQICSFRNFLDIAKSRRSRNFEQG